MAVSTTLAVCIARWLYQQAAAVLDAIRSFLETIIALIDAQILALRALLAMLDPAKFIEEQIWNRIKAVIDKIKSALLAGLPGPGQDECPEFYALISDPALALLESSLAAFEPYKDRYLSMISFLSYFDQAIAYWETTKAQLLAMIDVIDDALYQALMDAANNVE